MARLNDTRVYTTQDVSGNYQIVNFGVTYTIPAHYKYNTTGWDKPPTTGRFDVSVNGCNHQTYAYDITVNYAVNLTNMGMIRASDGVRYWGASSTVYLNRPTIAATLDSGSGAKSWKTFTCGDKLSGLPGNPTKQYYDFDGWVDRNGNDVDGNTTVCAADNAFSAIRATWVHQTADIIFNPCGGNKNAYTQTVNLGENKNLTANSFTREGYAFAGWATDPETKKKVYSDQSTVNLKTQDDLELFALWQKNDASFDSSQLIEDAEMFGADGELVGGSGTTFDRGRVDSRFAHIDGGKDDPAYFTKK